MLGVLSGFFIISVLIAVGIAAGLTGILGPQGRFVLNRITYFVGTPALVFTSLMDSDLSMVLSPHFAIAAIAAFMTVALTGATAHVLLRRRPEHTLVTAVSASMVNSANMGFPLAAYVLGDVAFALPIVLFQMALFTPMFQFVLHAVKSGQRPSLKAFAANVAANPTIIAAAIGIALLAAGWSLPAFAMEPIEILGGLSIPGLLISFGMSLVASKPLAKTDGVRADVFLASAFKLIVMPLVAFGAAAVLFGLSGHALFAAVVMAALPTAQNVYVTAAHYETAEEVSRDTALVTSVGTLLVLLAVSPFFT